MNIISPVFDQSHPTWRTVDYDRFTSDYQELIARAMAREDITPKRLRPSDKAIPAVRGKDQLKHDGIPLRALRAMKPDVIYTARELAKMVDTDPRQISDAMRALIAREMASKVKDYVEGLNGYYRKA